MKTLSDASGHPSVFAGIVTDYLGSRHAQGVDHLHYRRKGGLGYINTFASTIDFNKLVAGGFDFLAGAIANVPVSLLKR
ncbi:unnamed protein product [Clonostachys rosea]|uniref:Uncharacterized protein n=1 Tax=Bionectria ochroleuca TaxID=29856 RepID=A0ABY6U671_BIOOC|nr:unnamed protein product [Clonostachys rosea]